MMSKKDILEIQIAPGRTAKLLKQGRKGKLKEGEALFKRDVGDEVMFELMSLRQALFGTDESLIFVAVTAEDFKALQAGNYSFDAISPAQAI